MSSNKKNLIALTGIGIIAIAIVFTAMLQNSDPTGTGERSKNPTIPTDSAPDDTLQQGMESQSRLARKSQVDTRLRGQMDSMPSVSMDEHQTAGDALRAIAEWSDMSERDVQLNAGWWRKACIAVRTPNGNFPPMLETEAYRLALEDFESFCSGIENFQAPNGSSAQVEDVNEVFDRIENARTSPPESWPDKIERLGREGALEAAFDRLRNAIRNVDEEETRAAILNILRSGLYPQIEETGPRSRWGLQRLNLQLANTLLCQRMDGCRGPSHPYVVKYCLIEYEYRTRVCDLPNSIEDAIYQTLTPVEFENYLQFYGWIRSQLARS